MVRAVVEKGYRLNSRSSCRGKNETTTQTEGGRSGVKIIRVSE